MPLSLVDNERREGEAPPEPNAGFGSAGASPSHCLNSSQAEALGSRLADELAAAWLHGVGPSASELLDRHPPLHDHPQVAVRLIYEELCLRQEAGQHVDTARVLDGFPQWRDELEVLLECHQLMQAAGPPVFPTPGEELGEFHLLAELGRGATGRVFLATQPALSDRPVVLKLTPCSGGEHLSLAQLQHTAIVPLVSVHDLPERNLRAICMPSWGGTSLANCLAQLRTPLAARTGRDLVEVLRQAPAHGLPAFQGPALKLLAGLSYPDAICWIAACLADGLHYAHERGLMHLDVKPANVLLAGDGQPMLLDFHLAQEFIRPGETLVEHLGGSPGYMSPEQQQAMAALRQGRRLETTIDGRSDIYSLGVVLYEALSGVKVPGAERLAVHLRPLSRINRQVSRGLSDIVHKCLAEDPGQRYQDAGALAEDLRRHLAGMPLVGVPNRSLVERWRKWRRRRPHRLFVLVFLFVAVLVVVGYYRGQEQAARSALADGREHLARADCDLAIECFQRGCDAVRWLPGQSHLRQSLALGLTQAEQSFQADRLHAIVDQLRLAYALESLPEKERRELEKTCRALWESHPSLYPPNESILEESVRRRMRIDLLDLAILSADLRARRADDQTQARREALALIDEAQAAFGTSPILRHERRRHAATLGAVTEDAELSAFTAQTAWEHYALGRCLLRAGRLEQAAGELEQSIHLEPHSLWPSFYYATCAHRQGKYQEAIGAWNACIALDPAHARCYYNRGLAYKALRQMDRARRDFDKALSLDLTLPAPAIN